jgi:hypothetical protein
MRLCAVVGWQPMVAARDDGPECPRGSADGRNREEATTKHKESEIENRSTVESCSAREISATPRRR